MSRIYFASRDDDAELRGSERAYMGLMVSHLTVAAFQPRGWRDDPLFRITGMDESRYNKHGGALDFRRDFENRMSAGDYDLIVGDRRVSSFLVSLNTALVVGGDVLRLMARLHGQCELHAWVDGPNRAWLADMIVDGRKDHLLRADQGWEAVEAFLRQSSTEPVVTSYSVTDGFPNETVAGFDGGDEAWEALSRDERWDKAMAALRSDEGAAHGLEMRPDRWEYGDFYFGDGDTAFSILAATSQPVAVTT